MATVGEKLALTDAECVAMEKELYEESIRCLEARLKDLQNGTLDEFVERCKAFELAKTYRIDLAALHRKLLLRNIDELLAFDFQQIDDGFNASLEALQSTAPPNVAQQVEPVAESPHATAVVTDSDDPVRHELKQLELEKHLHFSMDHVNTCLPAATAIQAQLQALRDSLDIVNEKLRHATHLKVHYDADEADTVYAGNVILYVGDAVVLTSEIAQEDFYGSIHAIDESAVHLHLVCGNLVQVTLDSLRDRRCRLRFQDSAKNGPVAVHASPSGRKTNTTPRSKRTVQRKRLVSLI